MYSSLRLSALRPPPCALYPLLITRRSPPGVSEIPKIRLSGYAGDWYLKTAPLNVSYTRQYCIVISVILPVNLYTQQPLFLMHSLLRGILAIPSKTGCSLTLPLCTREACPDRDWHCETATLNVSRVRQDFIALAVILAVTLYIWQPLFLMHSVHVDLLAMSWKTGCPFALTLHTRGLSSAVRG